MCRPVTPRQEDGGRGDLPHEKMPAMPDQPGGGSVQRARRVPPYAEGRASTADGPDTWHTPVAGPSHGRGPRGSGGHTAPEDHSYRIAMTHEELEASLYNAHRIANADNERSVPFMVSHPKCVHSGSAELMLELDVCWSCESCIIGCRSRQPSYMHERARGVQHGNQVC